MTNKTTLDACKRVVDKISSMTPEEIKEKYDNLEIGPIGVLMLEAYDIEEQEEENKQ